MPTLGKEKTSQKPQIFFVIPSKIGKAKTQEGCTADPEQCGNYMNLFLSFVNVCVFRPEKNTLTGQLGEICIPYSSEVCYITDFSYKFF